MNMCGRYSIAVESSEVERHFRATFAEPMKPRYKPKQDHVMEGFIQIHIP
jgi:hypothetical protein